MYISSPVDDENFGTWVLAKARGHRETKEREALYVSKEHGDRKSLDD